MIEVVRAEYVVGYRNDDHVIHAPGEVAFENGEIRYVGRSFPGTAGRVHDMGLALVMPGLIDLDALADIDHALIDTWHSDETAPGLDWSEEYATARRRDVFGRDDVRFRHRYAFGQLIRNGITTGMPIGAETHNVWAESGEEWEDACESAHELGIRMYLGMSYRAGVPVRRVDGSRSIFWNEPLGHAGFEEALKFALERDEGDDGLIRTALLPCRIETQTPEILKRTARASQDHGLKVRLHCLQSLFERKEIWTRHGKSVLALLEDVGLLNSSLLLPHGIYFGTDGDHTASERDLEWLARQGVTIVHCPMTSVRYGNALNNFARFRRAGVAIAMGTDSFPPDLLRGMDLAVHLPKLLAGERSPEICAEVFRAATLGGAAALGRQDLGRLAPGAKADIVAIDLSAARVGAIDDPIRTMLMSCTGSNVRSVWIRGRQVLVEGRLPGVDDAAEKQRATKYLETMKSAYSERDFRTRPVDELFRPTFAFAQE